LRIKFGVIFIISGLLLLFYPQIEKKALDKRQEELIQAFLQIGDGIDYEVAPQHVEAEVDQEQLEQLDGARGIVRIPKIDLEMMVFDGSSDTVLMLVLQDIELQPEGNNSIVWTSLQFTILWKLKQKLELTNLKLYETLL